MEFNLEIEPEIFYKFVSKLKFFKEKSMMGEKALSYIIDFCFYK